MDYSYCRVTSGLGWYLEDVHLGLRAAAGVAGAAAAAVAGIYLIFLSTSGTTSSSLFAKPRSGWHAAAGTRPIAARVSSSA